MDMFKAGAGSSGVRDQAGIRVFTFGNEGNYILPWHMTAKRPEDSDGMKGLGKVWYDRTKPASLFLAA